MRENRQLASITNVALVAAGAATLGAAYALLRRRRNAGLSDDERVKLLAALHQLSKRFFLVCRNLAGIARTVRLKIEAGRVDITEEKLRQQLSHQCKVYESLQDIQTEVAKQFGMTAEALQELQGRASGDAVVQAYTDGFKTMLDDALSGVLPIFPNMKIPSELTEEKVLEIQAEAQAMELQKVVDKVGKQGCTIQEFSTHFAEAQVVAWDEVLLAKAGLEKDQQEIYYSALATYMRDPHFAKERESQNDAHKLRLQHFLKPVSAEKPVASPP
eukprot:TRINITY_DN47012_c0_g1_i1.p1 TRINITY_DN47012_c0_g1~~TRINITY_DN47012_c0_g1_i1.p1  ORF type:complete len:273 (-),score=63.38 TRINITY_DN47012_c0_g1_i1:90-908(-)